jgi:hypothetical protein
MCGSTAFGDRSQRRYGPAKFRTRPNRGNQFFGALYTEPERLRDFLGAMSGLMQERRMRSPPEALASPLFYSPPS